MDAELMKLWKNKQPSPFYHQVGTIVANIKANLERLELSITDELIEAWLEIAGSELSEYVRPYQLRGDTLLFQADTPAAAFEVEQLRAEEIKERLSSVLKRPILRIKCIVEQ